MRHRGGDEREIEFTSASEPPLAVFQGGCGVASAAQNVDRRRKFPDEGSQGADGAACGFGAVGACAGLGECRRRTATTSPAASRRTRNPRIICQKKRKKGAFFRSNNATVFYTVCVKFPTKKNLCAPRQEAVQGTLYVNKITSNIPGKHVVSWFVEGKKVGSFAFRVPK